MDVLSKTHRFFYSFLFFFAFSFSTQAQNLEFVDIHNSSLFRLLRQNKLNGLYEENAIVNVKQLKDRQTRFMVFSVGVPFLSSDLENITISDVLDLYRKFNHHYRNDLQLTTDKKNFNNAQKENKIPYCFALEGTHLLSGNISWLDSLHQVGVRFITLGHWFQNAFIVSPNDTLYQNKSPIFLNENSILSTKGKVLIGKMAKLGIVLDVSHLPESIINQIYALQLSQLSIIASHSNTYKVYSHKRNLSDDIIRKISKEGLIGICFHQSIIGENSDEYLQKLILHIQHISQIGGDKCIAIGSDYEGGIKTPKELEKLNGLIEFHRVLKNRGLSHSAIRKFYWKNALRFLKKHVLHKR